MVKRRVFMMAQFRRAFAALVSALFLLAVGQVRGALLYTTNEGSITITGWTPPGNEMVVPEVIDGLPVTRIARLTPMSPASYAPPVRRVVIGNSVTNIADKAFYGWDWVTNVVIGSGLSSLGAGAFDWCLSLANIEIAPGNATFSSINGVVYDKTQSTLILYPAGKVGTFKVPEGVIEIAARAFLSNRFLSTITLPSSVTRIGPAAFLSCTALTAVTNASGVVNIGEEAFAGSGLLSRITLGENLANIGRQAFRGCGIASVTIGPMVQTIGERAFAPCFNLTTITVDPANPFFSSTNGVLFDKAQTRLIQFPGGKLSRYTVPAGVTEIGDSAFYSAFNVTGVTLPTTVTKIGKSAFEGATKLATINIPDGITTIDDRTFYRCLLLTNAVIPNGVTRIGDSAFSGTRLPSVTIPESVVTIGSWAFNSLPIVSVVIPNSVTNMGSYVFASCQFLRSARLGSGIDRVSAGTFAGCSWLRDVTMGENITSIGESAFSTCFEYSNVVLPHSVTNIGARAFMFAYSLTNLAIPPDVKAIGDEAFYFSGLTSIDIPDEVVRIGTNAFERCKQLTSITIPSSVTFIGANCFNETERLQEITVDSSSAAYSSRDGVLFNGDGTLLIHYPSAKAGTEYEIPAGVAAIESAAFRGNPNLGRIRISEGVTSIGESAFSFCTNLTQITIANSVTSIGRWAFSYCTNLSQITFGSKLIHIGTWAFSSCFSLTSLTLPEGLQKIESSAFASCTNLASVKLPASLRSLDDQAFAGSRITEIGLGRELVDLDPYAFSNCSELERISVDEQNIVFSSRDGVLFNDDQTRVILFPVAKAGSYVVPESVRAIGDAAFSFCQGLTNVTIGSGVTNVGPRAFYYSHNLAAVYFRGDRPASGSSVFYPGDPTISYYLPGTEGWTDTFGGRPAELWNPRAVTENSFGIRGGQFGFDISGNAGVVVVIEAADNLVNPQWIAIATNTLAGATSTAFNDPTWRERAVRIFRFRSPR